MPMACGKTVAHAVARHAVQAFVPIIVGRHAQPRNGRRVVAHLLDFFGQRHPAHEVVHAGGHRLRRRPSRFRGPATTGGFSAAVSSAFTKSAARMEMMDCAGGIACSSNVFNLAASGAPDEIERQRPARCIAGEINPVREQENLSRAAGGGKNVEVAGERLVAAGDVERALAGVRENPLPRGR